MIGLASLQIAFMQLFSESAAALSLFVWLLLLVLQ
jgi:hypothetical protein